MNLVTGATGLVGSHLLLHLIENNEPVKALYRNSNRIEKTKKVFEQYNKSHLFDKIEWLKGDILDIPSLESVIKNVDYVYHCAAFVSLSPTDEKKMRQINIEGTANLVNVCLDNNIKKFCHISSIASLGDVNHSDTFIDEETPWNADKAHGDYALSKHGSEMEVFRAQQEGLNVVIVNPGIILGPGFPEEGSSQFFSAVKKGFKFYTQGTTGFVAVTDVVKAMYKLMKSNIVDQKFVLVSENLSLQTIFQTIALNLNKKAPSILIKPWITNLAWKIDWLLTNLKFKKRSFSRFMAESSQTKSLYSSQKIKETLQFEFQPIKDYIKQISKFYK